MVKSASFKSSAMYRVLAFVQVAMLLVVLWLAADPAAHRRWHAHPVSEGVSHSDASHSQCRFGNRRLEVPLGVGLEDLTRSTAVREGSNTDRLVSDAGDAGDAEEAGEAHGCVVELVLQGQALPLIWGAVVVPVWTRLESPATEGPVRAWVSISVDLLPFSCGPPASLMPSTC